jgi:predicted methyltransferase
MSPSVKTAPIATPNLAIVALRINGHLDTGTPTQVPFQRAMLRGGSAMTILKPRLPLIFAFACVTAFGQQATITPTAKELNKSFDADASKWTERFEHEGRAIYDKRMEVLDAMGLKPGMDVADIGAGSGLFSRLIAGRVGPGGTVYAVDIAKNMIDHIPNLKAVLGEPHSPKLAANSVDVVCIIDSYHHFEYPADMLAEISKAIRPDGVLVLIDFKRIDGISRDYILKMVRAGEGTFTDEFLNAGFDLVDRRDDMFPDNYFLKFRHRQAAAKAAATGGRD